MVDKLRRQIFHRMEEAAPRQGATPGLLEERDEMSDEGDGEGGGESQSVKGLHP